MIFFQIFSGVGKYYGEPEFVSLLWGGNDGENQPCDEKENIDFHSNVMAAGWHPVCF